MIYIWKEGKLYMVSPDDYNTEIILANKGALTYTDKSGFFADRKFIIHHPLGWSEVLLKDVPPEFRLQLTLLGIQL